MFSRGLFPAFVSQKYFSYPDLIRGAIRVDQYCTQGFLPTLDRDGSAHTAHARASSSVPRSVGLGDRAPEGSVGGDLIAAEQNKVSNLPQGRKPWLK